MKKRILSFFIVVLTALSISMNSFAAGLDKLDFNGVNDFSIEAQGINNWYYQCGNGTSYDSYSSMVISSGRWARLNDSNQITNNIYRDSMQPNAGAYAWTARVWVAPYDGTVNVGINGNLRRGSTASRVEATARIAHTNSEFLEYTYADNTSGKLWSGSVGAGDTVGIANAYNLEVAVKKGDRLYFEVTTSNISNGEVLWNPTVSYIQAVSFSVDGETKDSISEVATGDVITCEIYNKNTITEATDIYLVAYDKLGRLRAIGGATSFDVSNTSNRKAEATISMPSLSEGESYEGWKVGFIALTQMPGRFYPMLPANDLFLK